MATLRGYFDESCDEPSHPRVISFAGYIASIDTWERFGMLWRNVLNDFDVPYLHMKEFAHSTGAFKSWKGDERKRKEFIQALVRVVANSGRDLFGVYSVVEMCHLRRFNATYEQSIEGYPFCMSTCAMELIHVLWNTGLRVEAFCDRIDRQRGRIARAREY